MSFMAAMSAVAALNEFGSEHCLWYALRPALEACLADDGTHPLATAGLRKLHERDMGMYFLLTPDNVVARVVLNAKMDEHQRRVLCGAIRGQLVQLRARIGNTSPPMCSRRHIDWQSQNRSIELNQRLIAHLEPPPPPPPLSPAHVPWNDDAVPPPYDGGNCVQCPWCRLHKYLRALFRALVIVM